MTMLHEAGLLARQRIDQNTNRNPREEKRLPDREIAEWMEHHAEVISGFCDFYFECCSRLDYLQIDNSPDDVFGHKLRQYRGKNQLVDRAINDILKQLLKVHPFTYGDEIPVFFAGPAVTVPFCKSLLSSLESDADWLRDYVHAIHGKAVRRQAEERGYRGMSEGVGALGSVARAIRSICEVRRDVDKLVRTLQDHFEEHISRELTRPIREVKEYIKEEKTPSPNA